MMQPSKTFRKKSGTTLAGMFGAAVVSALLLCGAGNTPTGNIQTGDMNANGHAITNAANVATTNLNVATMAALPANTTVGGTNFNTAISSVFPLAGIWGTDFHQNAGFGTGGERGAVWYSINGTTVQAAEIQGFGNYAPTGGVRDPSIQEVGTNYIVTYTILSGTDANDMGVATTSDLANFSHVTDLAPTSPHTKIVAPKWLTDPTTGNRYVVACDQSGALNLIQNTNTSGSTWGTPSANFTYTTSTQINASDPCMVWDSTASLWRLYFVDEADTTLGWAAMHMATNPTLSASGWTDTGKIVNIPTGYYLEGDSVVKRATDGTWIMRCGTAVSNGVVYSTSSDGVNWAVFQQWPEPPNIGGINGTYDNGSTLNVADGQTQSLLLQALANQSGYPTFVGGLTVDGNLYNGTLQSNLWLGRTYNYANNALSFSGLQTGGIAGTLGVYGGDSTGDLYEKAIGTGVIDFMNPSGASMGTMTAAGVFNWLGSFNADGFQDTTSGHTNAIAAFDGTGNIDPITVGSGLAYNTSTKTLSASGGGTVTSVTFTGDGVVDSSTASSAVTTSGTVAATPLTQSANKVLAGPTTGSAATPTFRSLVAADLPTVPVAQGGTGATTLTSGDIVIGNGTSAVTLLAPGTGVATGLAANVNSGSGFETASNAASTFFPFTGGAITGTTTLTSTTSPQFSVDYDGSHYLKVNIDSSGNVTFGTVVCTAQLSFLANGHVILGQGSSDLGSTASTYSFDAVNVWATSSLYVGSAGTGINGIIIGTGTLASGSASLSNSAISTTSAIIATHLGSSVTNAGALFAYPTSSGSGTVKSTNSSDNDTFTYIVVNH